MSGSSSGEQSPVGAECSVTVRLRGFSRESVEQESARLGVSVDDLVAFSVMYYLADVDSGRIARRISKSPYADADASS